MRKKRLTWGRLLLIAFGLLLVAGGAAYRHATQPEQLRAQLAAALSVVQDLSVQADDLSFSLFGGLELQGVVIRRASSNPLPATMLPTDADIIRIEKLSIRHDTWALLFGTFRPIEMTAHCPSVLLVRDRASGRSNWADEIPVDFGADTGSIAGLPAVHLKGADVQLISIEHGRRRVLKRTILDGEGFLDGDGYAIKIRYSGELTQPLASARWHPDTNEIHGAMDWINLETAIGLAPPDYAQFEQKLLLQGRVRFSDVVMRGDRILKGTIEFEDMSCSPPLSEADAQLPPADRFIRITKGVGRARLEGDHISISAATSANAAPATITLDANVNREDAGESTYDLRLDCDGIRMPVLTEPRQAAFIQGLPPPVRSFFQDYRPDGFVRASLKSSRAAGGPVDFQGRIDFLTGTCRYFRFPYEFDRVSGGVGFSPSGVVLDDLEGWHGSGHARLRGRLNNSFQWTGFEVAVRAENVPLDVDLFNALPPAYQRLWSETTPIGLSNVDVAIRREEGSAETGPLEPSIRVDAELLSGSLAIGVGQRLTHADGHITVEAGLTTVRDLSGRLGDALVRLSGTIQAFQDERAPQVALEVRAGDMPIHYSGDSSAGVAFLFGGVGDVWGSVRRGQSESDDDRYVVQLKNGVLQAGDSPRKWSNVTGWIHKRVGEMDLIDFAARQDAAKLTANGVLPAGPRSAPLTLEMEADNLDMSTLFEQGLPAEYMELCRKLRPSGSGRVVVRMNPAINAAGKSCQTTDIQLAAARLSPLALPVEFHDVSGAVSCSGGEFQLKQFDASCGERGRVTMLGRGGLDPARSWADLALRGSRIDVTPELLRAMPDQLRSLLTRLAFSGGIELNLDSLRYDSAADRPWSASGALEMDMAKLDIGLLLEKCRGRLTGEIGVDRNGQPVVSADFVLDHGSLAGRPVEAWQGHILQAANQSTILIENAHGRMCGGDVAGMAQVDLRNSTYDLSIVFHDQNFDQFLGRTTAGSEVASQGKLDGHLFLRGRIGDLGTRVGGGDLRIRGASLMKTPLLDSVAQSARAGAGAINDELNSAELRFSLEGDQIQISRIDMQSRDLRLVGEGKWNLRSDVIDMTLVGAHPRNWPRVLILSDIIELAGKELMQYRLTGSASSPHVAVEPLHNLTDPLRRLISSK